MRAPAFVLLIGLIAAAGCKRREDGDPTKVTASSKDDATKPLIDEDYRFELAWPGAGWKITREADTQKLVPDAVAGVLHGDALYGAIIVESAPGANASEFADLLLEQLPFERKVIEERKTITYAGQQTERYVVTGTLNGVEFRFVNHVLVRDQFVFQLLGWGHTSKVSASAVELKPFYDAFKPLPGAIKGRTPPPVLTADGVGWRVKDGVFESAVTGVRVRAQDGWRLLVGEPLARTSADAEIAIAHSNPDVYIALIPERAPPVAERPAYLQQMRSQLAGTEGGDPHRATFAGAELEMARITATEGVKLEYLHGVHYANNLMVQVQAWFHAADRERALKVLPAGLAAFELLPPAEQTALLATIQQRRDPQAKLGPGFSLRGGVYRSFAGGWRWTKPAGPWRITSGDEARAKNPEVELSLHEPAKFIYAMVLPQRTDDPPDGFHELVLAANPGRALSTRRVGAARVTVVDRVGEVGVFRYHIATLVEDGLGLQVMLWGHTTDMDANVAAIDAAIAGFEIEQLETTTRRDGEYIDHRFGFAVREPGPGFTLDDQTPKELEAIATIRLWSARGGQTFGAFAVAFPTTAPDEQWALDFLEQILRDRVGTTSSGRAQRSEATLGGLPARKLSWDRGLTAYVIPRDGNIYMVVTSPGAGSASSFRFLD